MKEVKKHVLKIRAVDREVYDLIASGKKKIETRAGNDRYAEFQEGDVLVFKCGKDSIEKTIKKRIHFDTVSGLLEMYSPEQIRPGVESTEELEKMYKKFPGYIQRIAEKGILAWELE